MDTVAMVATAKVAIRLDEVDKAGKFSRRLRITYMRSLRPSPAFSYLTLGNSAPGHGRNGEGYQAGRDE